MQLVILHYHLNRGGVTTVVENHLRSLALLKPEERPSRVAIVYGGRAAAWNESVAQELPFECSLIGVPELEYDQLRESESPLYDALQTVLQSFDRDSTVLHVHNHSLGKNAAMAPVVCRLADEGWRLLLQIHDFAEDLRPANYQHLLDKADSVEQLRGQLYPQADQIHYAVLNQRDRQIMAQAGIDDERLHLLPNPVRAPQHLPDARQVAASKVELMQALGVSASHRLVLYPVRPIRRKNLGELLLWSLLAGDTTFALTLAPLNSQERTAYQQWVEFATELNLPIQFEVANKTDLPFEEIYTAADAIITTSVAEGFGLVFLEASLAGRQLVGRSLPSVCNDFEAAGMQFPGLAETMAIPVDEIDLEELRLSAARRIDQLRAAYGLPLQEQAASPQSEAVFAGDMVDFGRLELSQQRSFLRRVKTEADLRKTLRALNPTVQSIGALSGEDLKQTITNNCRVIAQHYSPEVIGEKLGSVYRALLASCPSRVACEPALAGAILDRFVHPSQLFPIRLES
ncbi:MAG: glycosyltransferase family 4 protein [Planctomycetes bacterium]|nr:glycosyltransferase family 4 protein [Planctomycetota bacterium]